MIVCNDDCIKVLAISRARARAGSCCERFISNARYGGAGQRPPWPLSRWRARTCRGTMRSLRRHQQLCCSEVSSLVELQCKFACRVRFAEMNLLFLACADLRGTMEYQLEEPNASGLHES
eukprot:5497017-Pleurochrysis_carterae.AAC.1